MQTILPKFAAIGILLAALGFDFVPVLGVAGIAVADNVKIVDCPDSGAVVAARADAAGTIHLLYHGDDGPRYVKTTDRGASFSQPIPIVVDRPKIEGLEFTEWDLAVGRGGSVHVALGTNAWKLKLPQDEWGYYYARLPSGATQFSPLRNINHKPSEGFSLAADDQGNLTLCWLSDRLYANVSHDDGATFGPNLEINSSYDPCNCCTTSAVYGSDGRLSILYREETDNRRDMYVVLWNQATGETERTRVSETLWQIDACPMTYFALSRAAGGYIAAWPTKGDIFFARLDADGKPVAPGETKTPGTAGMRTGILALCRKDGSILIAWKKDGRLSWQRYGASGQPMGTVGSVASRGDGVAGVVDDQSGFILFR
jgi:hypothetical protein